MVFLRPEQVLLIQHTRTSSVLLYGVDIGSRGVLVIPRSAQILRRTLGEAPLVVSKSSARISRVTITIVVCVGVRVIMGLFVVMESVWIFKVIVSTVALVLRSALCKIGAPMQCAIMVGDWSVNLNPIIYTCILFSPCFSFFLFTGVLDYLLFLFKMIKCRMNNQMKKRWNLHSFWLVVAILEDLSMLYALFVMVLRALFSFCFSCLI